MAHGLEDVAIFLGHRHRLHRRLRGNAGDLLDLAHAHALAPDFALDLGQNFFFHQVLIDLVVHRQHAVLHLPIPHGHEQQAYLEVGVGLAAGGHKGIGQYLGTQGIFMLHQFRIMQQHAHALFQGEQFVATRALHFGGHFLDGDGFFERVRIHQIEFAVFVEIGIFLRIRFAAHADIEAANEMLAKTQFDALALVACNLHGLEIEVLGLQHRRLVGEREKLIGQPLQHAGECAGQAANGNFAAAIDNAPIGRRHALGLLHRTQDALVIVVAHDLFLYNAFDRWP